MASFSVTSILFLVLLATIPPIFSNSIAYMSTQDLLNPRHSRGASAEAEAQKTGDRVANFNKTSTGNPEELGEYFEGDIRFPYPPNGETRLAFQAVRYHWPNAVVPYTIDGHFSSEDLETIKWAMNQFRQKTCINFKPRSGESDYVSIVNRNSGCWAVVGRSGGKQEVNFQTPGCMWKRGVVLHELMHAVGFLHEHKRYDRDGYVTVHMENIQSGKKHNFNKEQKSVADVFGFDYDYGSVMHYSSTAFSKNGKETITAKKDTEEAKHMGQRDEFSESDVAKLRAMYKC